MAPQLICTVIYSAIEWKKISKYNTFEKNEIDYGIY